MNAIMHSLSVNYGSVLLLEPLLCCLGHVYLHAGCNALALTVYRSFDAAQLPCPLSRKTPPKHNISTSMFDGGDGVLGVIGSIHLPSNTASWIDAKELDFGLIWPQHFHPVLLWIIGKLQTDLYMCMFVTGNKPRLEVLPLRECS